MRIPKSFKLFGTEIEIIFDTKRCDQNECWGLASFKERQIVLTKEANGTKLSKEIIEQTFYHELMHMIMEVMEERDLRTNEKFINISSSLLHQAFKTAEY